MKPRRVVFALGGALVVVSGQGNAPVGRSRLQAEDTGLAQQRLSGHRNRLRRRGDYDGIERTGARALETNELLRKKNKKQRKEDKKKQLKKEQLKKEQRSKELNPEAAAVQNDDEDQGCICDDGGSQAGQYADDVVEGESATPVNVISLENEVNAQISKLYETGFHRNLARKTAISLENEVENKVKARISNLHETGIHGTLARGKGEDNDDDNPPSPKSKSGKKSKRPSKKPKSKKSKRPSKTAKSAKSSNSKGAKSKGSKSCVCSPAPTYTPMPTTMPTTDPPTVKGCDDSRRDCRR